MRVGVSLFVRLLRKGAKGHNADGLRRMARQLPTLLANLPPMALAGCPAAPRRKPWHAAGGDEEQEEQDEEEEQEEDDDKEEAVERGNIVIQDEGETGAFRCRDVCTSCVALMNTESPDD